EGDAREALLIREREGHVEVRIHLPRGAADGRGRPSFDELCQIIEGVSHFLYVAERARRELPATQLELELQAEVDKYIFLSHDAGERDHFEPRRAARRGRAARSRVAPRPPPGAPPAPAPATGGPPPGPGGPPAGGGRAPPATAASSRCARRSAASTGPARPRRSSSRGPRSVA